MRRRSLPIAGLVVIAAVGYLGARALFSAGGPAPARTGSASQPASPIATGGNGSPVARLGTLSTSLSVVGRIPGAVAAAVRYLQLVGGGSEPADAAQVLRSVTRAPLTARAERALAASRALRRRLLAATPAFASGWPLGWRLLASRASTATVAVWTMGLVASRHVVLAPAFSTTVCMERLAAGRWAIVSAATRPGPTPPPDGSDRATVAAFARAAGRFVRFDYVS